MQNGRPVGGCFPFAGTPVDIVRETPREVRKSAIDRRKTSIINGRHFRTGC
jgi:hypothetical protein